MFANGFNTNLKNGPFFGYPATTVGPLFKLFGSTDYFVYAPVVLGYAITASSSGNTVTVGGSSSLTAVQVSVSPCTGIFQRKFVLLPDPYRIRSVRKEVYNVKKSHASEGDPE
ncbi:MAG: hypothetical protein ACYCYP_14175 [Leptospirales bacterium]